MVEDFDILVVDDDPVVLGAVKRTLGAEGYALDVAEDGESCLTKTEQNRYRLVLCDLMLPRVRGFDVVEQLRERLPEVPVVLISGYATLHNAVTGFRQGVFDFIPKPFDFGELLGVVRRGLDFSEGKRRVRLDGWLRGAHATDGGAARGYKLGGHAWVIVETVDRARVGLGETFAVLAGQPHDVELPAFGEELLQGNRAARLVGGDERVHRLWSPLSGKVIETNDRAAAELSLRDADEICKDWLITMIPSDLQRELPRLTPAWHGGGRDNA